MSRPLHQLRIMAIENGEKKYNTGEPCIHGHLSDRRSTDGKCIACTSQRSAEKYANDIEVSREKRREQYYKRREEIRQSERNKYNNDPAYRNRVKEINKKSREKYKSKAYDRVKKWRELNGKRRIETDCKRKKERRENDVVYALKERVSHRVRIALIENGYTKKSRTHEILGCSYEDFKAHIERQFLKGMSWDNRSEWHIDHIVPISSANTESEVIALNHYTNLRPLWAIDNLKKGAKVEYLL